MSSNIFLHSMQKIGTYFPLLTEDIGPNGKVTLSPGVRFRSGVKFMGIDITEVLDEEIDDQS